VIVVTIFFVILPRIVDFEEVWRVLSQMTWLEATSLAIAAAWNLVTYWLLMMVALPGLTLRQAMIVTETSTAIANTMPGGAVLGLGVTYSIYSSWGFNRARTAVAMAVSGFGDAFSKLALPVLALVLLTASGRANPALVTAAVIGTITLMLASALSALAFASEASARRVGHGLQRTIAALARPVGQKPPQALGEAIARFRTEAIALLSGKWLLLLVTTSLLSHISLFTVLLIALRHVGVSEGEVGWVEALGVFAFVRFLSALPLTPGGLGVIELGLTAGLVVTGGPEARVVAAVLVFRALTYLIQIPFGGLTYLYWQHRYRRRSGSPGPIDESPLDDEHELEGDDNGSDSQSEERQRWRVELEEARQRRHGDHQHEPRQHGADEGQAPRLK